MTSIRRILPLALLACTQLAQADTEHRSLADFSEVAASGGIRVEISQGAQFSVEVEADDPEDIVTEIVGNTLRIYRDSNWNWLTFGLIDFFMDSDEELKASVILPRLTRLRTTGGSQISGAGAFTGENLELRTSGGSDITLEFNVAFVDASTSGGSTMHLSGRAEHAVMQSSGGSRLDAADLDINEADLRSSGGSNLGVGNVGTLTARASGGSDIRYDGNPVERRVDTSGGADIKRR